MVKIAKAMMRKSNDAYAALLSYRNTLKSDTGLFPAQLFLMRLTRTAVSITSKLLVSKITNHLRRYVKNEKTGEEALQSGKSPATPQSR